MRRVPASRRRSRAPRRAARSGLAAAALIFLAGCGGGQKRPRFEAGDRTLLVVPFRDSSVKPPLPYGASRRGKTVADEFRKWAEKNARPRFADERDTEKVVETLREWSRAEVEPDEWRRLLAGTGADLVIVGEIAELRLQDRKSIGMLKGRIRGKFVLVEASTGREAYASKEIRLEYPRSEKLPPPRTVFYDTPEAIERGLLAAFGEQVGKDLYGAPEEP